MQAYLPAAFDDGLFEVVGVFGVMHLSHITARIRSGRRLGQFRELRIETAVAMPVQVDGEPWTQPPSAITVTRQEQVSCVCVCVCMCVCRFSIGLSVCVCLCVCVSANAIHCVVYFID